MDIYSLDGEKIRFRPEKVSDSLRNSGKEHLQPGEIYTVDYVWTRPSLSGVFLKEFPNMEFNTVQFENVDARQRRDSVFAEAIERSEAFRFLVHKTIPHNTNIRLGIGSHTLSIDEIIAALNKETFDKTLVSAPKRGTKEYDLSLTKTHSGMNRIMNIILYRNLVWFYFWNGSRQFLEVKFLYSKT